MDSHLRLAHRNDSAAGNKLGEDAPGCLNSKSQRSDINQDNVFGTLFTGQNTTLDSSTIGNSLIGVDTLRGFLAEVLLQKLLNFWNMGRTTDEDNLKPIRRPENDRCEMIFTSSTSSLLTLASFSTCSTGFMVLRNRSMLRSSNLAQVSVSEKSLPSSKDSISMWVDCWLERVQFRLLNITLELAHGTEVASNVSPSLFLVLLDKVVNDAVIKILSTKVGITGSCQDRRRSRKHRKFHHQDRKR